jgi:hypothetical protein
MKKNFTTKELLVLLQEKEFKSNSFFSIMTSYGEEIKLTAELDFATELLSYKLLIHGVEVKLTPEQEKLLFIDLFKTQPFVSEFNYDDQFHTESLIYVAHAC